MEIEARIRDICLALPRSYEKLSHGAPSFFVEKGRQFAAWRPSFHQDPRPQLWILATLMEQAALLSSGDDLLFRPQYVGHKGWIAMYLDGELDWDLISDLLARGNELAQPKR